MRYMQHKQIHNITYNYVFKTIITCNVSLLPIITYYYCFYSFWRITTYNYVLLTYTKKRMCSVRTEHISFLVGQ